MFLVHLKPLFEKFNSTNDIIDSEKAMKIVDECAAICKSFIKKFKFNSDICSELRYNFGLLYTALMKKKNRHPSPSIVVKEVLLNKIDMQKEILLRRLKQKSQIGTLDELPNHIIDYIYEKIIE